MIDLFFDERVLDHDTGAGLFDAPAPPWLPVPETHPENAERVRNMYGALTHGPVADAIRLHPGRIATDDELAWLHDPAYVASIRAQAAAGARVTKTTVLAPGSFEASAVAAGTALEAAAAVLAGSARIAYALVRPPGHHASQRTADGYCFFNATALAAEAARRAGEARVAIVDWDVHHGNGTQTIFYDRADVLTISLHMDHGSWGPSHPETGAVDEAGRGPGVGFNLNLPLPLGAGDEAYLDAFDQVVVPAIDRFRPTLLVVASGQDANQFDPNARQSVTAAGFRELGRRAMTLAERHANGRLLLVQEGGYARTYSAVCLMATLEGVLGRDAAEPDPLAFLPDPPGRAHAVIAAARAAHGL